MPEAKLRIPGTYAHYVTFSCYKRRKLLNPDICKKCLLGCLSAQMLRQRATCVGYVIMPDHVHAILWFPEEFQISEFLNKWKDVSSMKIGEIYRNKLTTYGSAYVRDDPVWQKRYYDFQIYSDEKVREKLDYMHNNPVRAGLVAEACDWPWSSARFWVKQEPSVVALAWPP